jgi:hypothetical protein
MPAAQATEFQKILPSFTDEEAAKALAIMEEVVSVNGRNGAPKVFCRFVRAAESIVGSIFFESDIGARAVEASVGPRRATPSVSQSSLGRGNVLPPQSPASARSRFASTSTEVGTAGDAEIR